MLRLLVALSIATLVGCTHKPPAAPVVVSESEPAVEPAPEPIHPGISAQVYFDFNSDSLADASALQPIIAFLLENPAYALHVDGYADTTGSTDYNMALSQRRADKVFTAISNTSPPRMGLSIGHGEAEERTVIIRVIP